jgi:hypothetical protein
VVFCSVSCIVYPSALSAFFISSCNNIGWRVKIMKLTSKQFSPACWYFVPHRLKYSW